MRGGLAALGTEALRLASGAAEIWLRLLPRLIALCLFGWVAYHGSVLLAVEAAHVSAWLLIPVLALGLVARLATVVYALRAVARALDAPALLSRVAPGEVVDDDRDASPVRLLTITLLPFLGVYAAFGYVTVFASDVVVLSTYRYGLFDGLLASLNPLNSVAVGVTTVAAVVGLFVGRRLLDRWHRRTGWAAVGLVAVLVEACGLFVVLLSGFRLWEQAVIWLGGRRVAQWRDDAVAWLSGWLHIDVPEVLERAWEFLAQTAWPVLWDFVTQPVAWLALTALVFGSRVLSLGDLWHTAPDGVGEGRLRRVRTALAGAHGARRVVLGVQEAFLGDIDDKYLPTWAALRLVLRAGWPFLGAFVLLFGLLRLATDWTGQAIVVAIGGRPPGTWMRLQPFLDLVPNVLGMSLQLALLGTAFVRILTRGADAATVRPAPAPRRLGEVALVGTVLVALTAMSLLNPGERTAVRTAQVGTPAAFLGGQVLVERVQLGTRVSSALMPEPESTPLVFVVVRTTVVRPGSAPASADAELVGGPRRYSVGGWAPSVLNPEPGFRSTVDLVFEVQPDDVGPALELRVRSPGVLSFYDEEVRVPLGLPVGGAAAAEGRSIDVSAMAEKAVA